MSTTEVLTKNRFRDLIADNRIDDAVQYFEELSERIDSNTYRNIIISNSVPDFQFLSIIAVISVLAIFILINMYRNNEILR